MSLTYKALIIALLFTLSFTHLHDSDVHRCTHDEQDHAEPEFIDVDDGPSEGRVLTTYPQFRIVANYDLIASSTDEYKAYVMNELIPPIISYYQTALKIKYPIATTISTTSTTVCSVATPAILLNGGVAADFVYMVGASYDEAGSWAASSTTCLSSSTNSRPLLGKTIINSASLTATTDGVLHQKNMDVVLHEMAHTLGFSNSLFKYFVDANGVRLAAPTTKVTIGTYTYTVVQAEPIRTMVRNYFGCADLEGAYMENSGTTATSGSHFERRFYGPEIMTSGLTYDMRLSTLTLGLLESSGWYVPSYTMADNFYWGQGQGCSFTRTTSCATAQASFDEFCTGSGYGCDAWGSGGGLCNSDTTSDGCTFVHPSRYYDCQSTFAGGYVVYPSIQTLGRGLGSKCFEGNLTTSSSKPNGTAGAESFCLTYKCNGSGATTTLDLNLKKANVTCTKAGGVKVPGFNGFINCPDPLTYCSTIGKAYCPRGCMGRGTCTSGKCVCKTGFTGTDCAMTA